jgi:hypothetical protein
MSLKVATILSIIIKKICKGNKKKYEMIFMLDQKTRTKNMAVLTIRWKREELVTIVSYCLRF